MGLSRTVSEITAIWVENRKLFPAPVYFVPPLAVFELGVNARGQKN